MQVERQNERGLAYGALAVLLGAAGLAMLAVPQRCVEYLWAATPSVLVAGMTRSFGSVLLLAAICAHCLKVGRRPDWWWVVQRWRAGQRLANTAGHAFQGRAARLCSKVDPAGAIRYIPAPPSTAALQQEAAEHGRMQSETYLRLNLGLLWWGLGSALALWLAPAQPLRWGQG